MSRRVTFRHEAEIEFNDAACWYEQRRPGLGREFVAEVKHAIERIRATPELFATVFRDAREANVDRFPYSVVYRLRTQEIRILAIFHGSRDPGQWRERL